MNKFFNAQNLQGDQSLVYLHWASDGTYSFKDEVGATVDISKALQAEKVVVKTTYFEHEIQGNYAVSKTSDGLGTILTLQNRDVYFPDIEGYQGDFYAQNSADIWRAAWKDGSPIYTFTLRTSGITTVTLKDSGTRPNFMNHKVDNISSETYLDDNYGKLGGDSSDLTNFLRDLQKTLVPTTQTETYGIGYAETWDYDTGGVSHDTTPFLIHYNGSEGPLDNANFIFDGRVTEGGVDKGFIDWESIDLAGFTYKKDVTEEMLGPTPYLVLNSNYASSTTPLMKTASSYATSLELDWTEFVNAGVFGSISQVSYVGTQVTSIDYHSVEEVQHPSLAIGFNVGTSTINVKITLSGVKDANWPERPTQDTVIWVRITRS